VTLSLRLLLAVGLAAWAAGAPAARPAEGYAATATDSARLRPATLTGTADLDALPVGASIGGFLSARGLPPRSGRFVVTDTGLVFLSADGRVAQTYPLIGPLRTRDGRKWRPSALSLAYADSAASRPFYLFRVDGAVFGTEAPGALLDLAARPHWLDSLASREWRSDRPLVNPRNQAAVWHVIRSVERSGYADTLYALFGRPARPTGLVSSRGRKAGRLGEYLASRDSLALDPARMSSEEQLRHAVAHELAHRWQARARSQLRILWQGVGRIRDPKRYGHDKVSEHQAEAIAFAVHYLQATAGFPGPVAAAARLEQYELLVPGTRAVARYLALQPIYAGHPLRRTLTTDPHD
jgi:hypothetical protein